MNTSLRRVNVEPLSKSLSKTKPIGVRVNNGTQKSVKPIALSTEDLEVKEDKPPRGLQKIVSKTTVAPTEVLEVKEDKPKPSALKPIGRSVPSYIDTDGKENDPDMPVPSLSEESDESTDPPVMATAAASNRVKEDLCPQLYDPCTREPIASIDVLDKRIRELKARRNTTPVGLYGLTNKTTVFINKTISLDDMVSFKLAEKRNPGSDIYEVLCRLFVFFEGIDGVNPRINGNYKFMQQIESKALKVYDDSIDALKQMECLASNKMGISDITLVNVKDDKKTNKPDDPYCEAGCPDSTDSQTIKTYLMSVKWYKEEKNAEHYDLEKLFATAHIRTTPAQNPIDIIVFLKSKKDFQIAHNRSYRQYTQHLAKTFYGWHEDVKPFLQKIRRQIFEQADISQKTPLEMLEKQYLQSKSKPYLSLQLHQDIIVNGVCNTLKESMDDKRYLIGVLPRGGKTYIAGGIIRKYLDMMASSDINIFWLTAVPTETLTQVRDDLLAKYEDFRDFEFIEAKDTIRKTRPKSVFFCSTQLLVVSEKSRVFKDITSQLGIIFFDEAHKTGTGIKTKSEIDKIIKAYQSKLPIIFLTATYYNILFEYGIQPTQTFIWDYTDVLSARALATDTDQEKAVAKLHDRFTEELVTDVITRRMANGETLETMAKAYIGFPDLYFISADFQAEAIQRFENQSMYSPDKGFSLSGIFQIKSATTISDIKTAQNKVRKDAYKIFADSTNPKNMISLITPREQFDDPEVIVLPGGEPLTQEAYVKGGPRPLDPSILGRIHNMSSDTKSRFRLDEQPSMLMFMPIGGEGTNILYLLCAWASLLMTHTWWRQNYEIACVVSDESIGAAVEEVTEGADGIHIISSNVKATLLQLEKSLHCRPQPKGLLVLAGQMLSMGISLPCTDVVFLLNETKSPDDIIQKMYRALTPSSGKTSAFVVDLNPVRTLAALYGYTKASHQTKHAVSEILEVIYDTYSWDSDVFEYQFTKGIDARPLAFQKRLEELFEKAEKDPEYRVQEDIGGLESRLKMNIKKGMNHSFITTLKGVFSNKKLQSFFEKIGLKDGSTFDVSTGKLVITVPKNIRDPEDEKNDRLPVDIIEITIENFADAVIDFIKYIALTSSTGDFDKALEEYERNQINNHGTSLQHNVLQYIKAGTSIYEGDDKELLSKILLTAVKDFARESSKSIFSEMKGKIDENKVRKDKILQLIHKRLTPRQKQQKQFGEVFTPIDLIEELFAHLPDSVWSNPNLTWFDPASGIGNFPVVIFYKLDEGLKKWEPSDTKRRKHIIEKMLFMVEIQSSNSRIARDIFTSLCPSSTPNIWTVDSLTILSKLKKKGWPSTYNMIVGNPPFQKGRNMQFYVKFINLAHKLLSPNGYLVYVIPNKILIPNKANDAIKQFNPIHIYHTVNDKYFPNIATTICAVIAKGEPYKGKTVLVFKNGKMDINLDIPTPTQYNDTALKDVSDKILIGRKKYLSISKDKPKQPHVYISRVWVRFSPDKPIGGSHVFNISDSPKAGDDGSGKYIIIPDTITKSTLVWFLSRSKVMRFITKIYAGAMNVPAFIWEILPSILLKKDNDLSIYSLLHLTKADQAIIESTLQDNIEELQDNNEELEDNNEELQDGGLRFQTTRKNRRI